MAGEIARSGFGLLASDLDQVILEGEEDGDEDLRREEGSQVDPEGDKEAAVVNDARRVHELVQNRNMRHHSVRGLNNKKGEERKRRITSLMSPTRMANTEVTVRRPPGR